MCKHVVKRVPYLIRYVSDQYKTQQMCDMAILANGGTLTSVSDCYKNQEMCNKTVDNYHHALYFVPLNAIRAFRNKIHCNKAVDFYPSTKRNCS